jgi:hypothetical protein
MVLPPRTSAPAQSAKSLNAKLVIWGRKIGDKQFNPRFGYLATGIANSAPLAMLSGQRCMTLL